MVYLLQCENGYKIGITASQSLRSRLSQLRCGNTRMIKVHGLWEFKNRRLAGAVERALHERYREMKTGYGGKEWFVLHKDATKAFGMVDDFCRNYGGIQTNESDCLIKFL